MKTQLLKDLYQKCFPHRDAEKEISALGGNFKFDILDERSFIIYNIVSVDEAEIIDIGTHPDFRGKGLAQKIIDKTMANLISLGVKTVYLEVAENNTNAIDLYTRTGFEKYNIRKQYYNVNGVKIDAILMKTRIDIKSE